VYPFYKKSCHFTPPNYDKIDPSLNITYDPGAFQAGGGPLEVSYGNYQGPYGPPIEASLDRLGFRKLPGLNSGRLIGYGTSTATIDTNEATRSSSETSFLQLAAARSSIKIYPSTLGSKILFDANNRATGVLVQTNSLTSRFTYGLTARREVIVSAGTVSAAGSFVTVIFTDPK
jgi:choline dehydrogenase